MLQASEIEKKYNIIADKIEEAINLKYKAQNNLLSEIKELETTLL